MSGTGLEIGSKRFLEGSRWGIRATVKPAEVLGQLADGMNDLAAFFLLLYHFFRPQVLWEIICLAQHRAGVQLLAVLGQRGGSVTSASIL